MSRGIESPSPAQFVSRAATGLAFLLAAALAIGFAVPSHASADSTMAVQADGKIVVVGFTPPGNGYVARFDPDGSLDRGFGGDGIVIDRRLSWFSTVALQPDGGIVVGAQKVVARFLPDGSPDLGFGNRGIAHFGEPFLPSAMAILADGGIAVAGTNHEPVYRFVSARLATADGSSAEPLGKLDPNSATFVTGLATPPDGSVVMTGTGFEGHVLARFLPGSGLPYDPAFGGGSGRVFYSPPPVEGGASNAIATHRGGLLVAGEYNGMMLARFDREGVLDTSFASGGFTVVDPEPPEGHSGAQGLVVQPDGRIVVAGFGRPPRRQCVRCGGPLVMRFLPNGAVDPSFGSGGVTRPTNPNGTRVQSNARDVAILDDGKVLVGGTTNRGAAAVLTRLLPDGSVDRAFGDGGVARVVPCTGSSVDKRLSGCYPRGSVRLSVRDVSRGQPAIRIHTSSLSPTATVRTVRVLLPRPLRVRAERAEQIEVLAFRGTPPRLEPWRGTTNIRLGMDGRDLTLEFDGRRAPAISLRFPPGLIRRVQEVSADRTLRFRVGVAFSGLAGDAGSRTFSVLWPR